MDLFPGQLNNAAMIRLFMFAGKATLTLRSNKSEQHFTYKIEPDEDGPRHYVKVLTGSSNESDYTFLGTIFDQSKFVHGKRSKITKDATSAIAFEWFHRNLKAGKVPATLSVWHEGRCARCSRKLTRPESIASGFGPECSELVGLDALMAA